MFCFLLGLKVGAFIFGILTIVKSFKYWQDPNRGLKERILGDAKVWEVSVPESYLIKKELFNVYRRIQRLEKSEAMLISSFMVVLDEFWQQASAFESESIWIENLRFLDRNLPKLSVDRNALTNALSELQNLNLHLEKASAEVKSYQRL